MSDKLLEKLREKTEEGNLNTILRPSIGGYTKQSVQEYLAFLKKQQQTLKDSYSEELQKLAAEKDALSEENETLRGQLENADASRAAAVEEKTAELKNECELLNRDMEEALDRIKKDGLQLEAYEKELQQERQKNEQNRQSAGTCRAMLDSANAKIGELNGIIRQQAAEIAGLEETQKTLRKEVSEGKQAELNARIGELLANSELLQKEIAVRDRELENRAKRLETLEKQEESKHLSLEKMHAELVRAREQNEWMESENKELGDRLREQMEQSIAMSREISRLKAANAILGRRLEMQEDGKLAEALG